MPKYIVDGSDLTSVANTIRAKGGTSGSLSFPDGWNSAISAIGGGGAEIILIPVTNILPSGKTLRNYSYTLYLGDSENALICNSTYDGDMPVVLSGDVTYIQINSGDSTVGDYLRVASATATGDIDVIDAESYDISGEGTLTLNWIVT